MNAPAFISAAHNEPDGTAVCDFIGCGWTAGPFASMEQLEHAVCQHFVQVHRIKLTGRQQAGRIERIEVDVNERP